MSPVFNSFCILVVLVVLIVLVVLHDDSAISAVIVPTNAIVIVRVPFFHLCRLIAFVRVRLSDFKVFFLMFLLFRVVVVILLLLLLLFL